MTGANRSPDVAHAVETLVLQERGQFAVDIVVVFADAVNG